MTRGRDPWATKRPGTQRRYTALVTPRAEPITGERLLRILARLEAAGTEGTQGARLCEVCADILDVSGAGIMLMSAEPAQGSICDSNPLSAILEDLQFTLGEGPAVDAFSSDRPVIEPDLEHPIVRRWSAFTPLAVEAGALAVFALPLRVGAIRLGVLSLHRNDPGPLTDDQHADALAFAGVAARSVLAMQAGAIPGTLGAELEAGSNFRFVVHQASGMVSAQLDVSVGDALVRLRAFAFGESRPLTEVAEDVVGRRLRFSAAI